MAMSEKQREANRINGSKGGPKTEAGKEISKLNATRHGLTANKVVLNSEEQPLFQAMLDGYIEELQPAGLEERDLVTEIVVGKWRQQRFWGIETALMDIALLESTAAIEDHFDQIEPLAKTAYALSKQYGTLKALEIVSRYEGRMRRLHQVARKDLETRQAKRKAEAKASSTSRTSPASCVPTEPLSHLSFITEAERALLNPVQNEPKFPFDLPLEDPNAA